MIYLWWATLKMHMRNLSHTLIRMQPPTGSTYTTPNGPPSVPPPEPSEEIYGGEIHHNDFLLMHEQEKEFDNQGFGTMLAQL